MIFVLAIVNVVPLFGLKVPPEAPKVIPRLVSSIENVAVVCRVPPFKVSWSAVGEPGFAPRPVSAAIESMPPLIVVLPVYVLTPLKVAVPEPVFVSVTPDPASIALIVPELVRL
jgi:hypothetical protein